jgi:acyl-CoA dehydrogenase
MSLAITGMLQAGETPNLEAALVRDLGNAFEREIPQLVRLMAPGRRCAADDRLEGGASRDRIAHVAWTLAGGTFSGASVRELLTGGDVAVAPRSRIVLKGV